MVKDKNQGKQKQAMQTLSHNHHYQEAHFQMFHKKNQLLVLNTFMSSQNGLQIERAKQRKGHASFLPNNKDLGARMLAKFDFWRKAC